jgi:hypothetical protein
MNMPEHFELREGYAFHSLQGPLSLQEAVDAANHAIAYCFYRSIWKLLINATGLTQLRLVSLADRFQIATRFAAASQGLVKVVLVVKPELIHPEKFAVTVARNRGMVTNVFPAEFEALEWLLNPATDTLSSLMP